MHQSLSQVKGIPGVLETSLRTSWCNAISHLLFPVLTTISAIGSWSLGCCILIHIRDHCMGGICLSYCLLLLEFAFSHHLSTWQQFGSIALASIWWLHPLVVCAQDLGYLLRIQPLVVLVPPQWAWPALVLTLRLFLNLSVITVLHLLHVDIVVDVVVWGCAYIQHCLGVTSVVLLLIHLQPWSQRHILAHQLIIHLHKWSLLIAEDNHRLGVMFG